MPPQQLVFSLLLLPTLPLTFPPRSVSKPAMSVLVFISALPIANLQVEMATRLAVQL